MPLHLWQQLAESFTHGSRSTVLKPLLWLIGLELTALISAVTLKAPPPTPVVVFLLVALGLTLVVALGAYIYFMIVDPAALRSENYGLRKMAIERGIRGDNLVGIIDEPASTELTRIEAHQPTAGQAP